MKIVLFSVHLPGNGQCSPGDENSRMLADLSAANGQTVPQGPNSPNGELYRGAGDGRLKRACTAASSVAQKKATLKIEKQCSWL